jgi:hypothetical protein
VIRVTIAVAVSLTIGLAAQSATSSAWSMPRMPDGHPDLQGVWANNQMKLVD